MLVGESSQVEDVNEDSDDDLGPNLPNETLASVEALNSTIPSSLTKHTYSDDEAILEDSRISSTMLKSNSASTSKVEDSSSGIKSQLKILPNLAEDSSKVEDFNGDSSKVEGCNEDFFNQDPDKVSGSSHYLAKVSAWIFPRSLQFKVSEPSKDLEIFTEDSSMQG